MTTKQEAADILACLASQPEYIEGGHDWTWQLVHDEQPDGHPQPLPLAMSDEAFCLATIFVRAVLDDRDAEDEPYPPWREMYAEAEARLRALL